MSARKQPKINENQTEIDFSLKDPELMSTKTLQDEANRLRLNIGSNMRRGFFVGASQVACERLSKILTQLSARNITQKNKMPHKGIQSLKNIMQEFFGRTPPPTYLEASIFVTAERKKWNGPPGAFIKTVKSFARVSESSIYRFIYVGEHLTPEAVAEISKTTVANKGLYILNEIAHLPRDVQHLPDAWTKVVKGWDPSESSAPNASYSYGPQPGQKSFPGNEPKNEPVEVKPFHRQTTVKDTEKYLDAERILAREDYHKIARIIGAQNNELRLKIKEAISENHKTDLQAQIDIATTMNHILKELRGIRALLTNSRKLSMKFEPGPVESTSEATTSCEAAAHGD